MKWYTIFLIPFSWLYGLIIWTRAKLYDINFFRSLKFDMPVIAFGNLSVGGTGKTPHTIYLAKMLSDKGYKVAVLSRGYKRITKGYGIVVETSAPIKAGDELVLIKQSLGDAVNVVVHENRVLGVINLLHDFPETEVIILDDAFQHRAIKPGLNILLTTAQKPFYKDFLLPAGSLRDLKSAVSRADVVMATKSNDDKTAEELKSKLKQPVFNSKIKYTAPTPIDNTISETPENWVVVAGIADPSPLVGHLKNGQNEVKLCQFPDHHKYTAQDILKVQKIFDILAVEKKGIITTAKDWVKIKALLNADNSKHWYIQDITIAIDAQEEFDDLIVEYVRTNKRDDAVHSEQN